MAKELFLNYYKDHSTYFDGLQNLVLHLHLHFDRLFDEHGCLCYLGTFSQEVFSMTVVSLIFSINHLMLLRSRNTMVKTRSTLSEETTETFLDEQCIFCLPLKN
jgi:hypothetical protein